VLGPAALIPITAAFYGGLGLAVARQAQGDKVVAPEVLARSALRHTL
jgi:hypothetical protein